MSIPPEAVLERAESLIAAGRGNEALEALRRLSIDEFGQLLLGVHRFPRLKSALPEMPSEQVQRDWTGNCGPALLRQTCAFVQSLEKAFVRLTRQPLEGRTILDYGCGWGRIMRLMYRFSSPEAIYGVDPWDQAIDICRGTRMLGNLAHCDYVPRELPFDGVTFDLVYAFSVFTHLSEKTARAVLGAIRRRIHEHGLFVLTVRPVDYWAAHSPYPAGTDAGTMRARHRDQGFAFLPHNRPPIDGDVTYGDASVAVEYVRNNWTEWRLVESDLNAADPYQLLLFLRPR